MCSKAHSIGGLRRDREQTPGQRRGTGKDANGKSVIHRVHVNDTQGKATGHMTLRLIPSVGQAVPGSAGSHSLQIRLPVLLVSNERPKGVCLKV